MPRVVRWSRTALLQLAAIRRHIAQDKPIAALRMALRIRNSTNILANFADAGRSGLTEETRQWVIPGTRYIATYSVTKGQIRILSIHHGMTDWKPEE